MLIPRLDRLGRWLLFPVTVVFSRLGWLSALYYAFLSTAFWREMRAVLAGRARYVRLGRASPYLLVRNVHRLEKGLLMRPRRDVFALEYISETVAAYKAAVLEPSATDRGQLSWATDVLTEYFNAVDLSNPVLSQQHDIFLGIRVEQTESQSRVPYEKAGALPEPLVSIDELLNVARSRKSVRSYANRPVQMSDVYRALDVAALAPTACNRQPYTFRFYDDPDRIAELSALPMGTRGWADTIPLFVVIVGNLDAYFSERDRHAIYIDASLAAMSFMLALETLGLSSCPINWPDIGWRERKMKRLLKLAPWQRPVLCMSVGYADPEAIVAYSEKRSLCQTARYNDGEPVR